eukprot:247533-Hanusia_phi.AAC.2
MRTSPGPPSFPTTFLPCRRKNDWDLPSARTTSSLASSIVCRQAHTTHQPSPPLLLHFPYLSLSFSSSSPPQLRPAFSASLQPFTDLHLRTMPSAVKYFPRTEAPQWSAPPGRAPAYPPDRPGPAVPGAARCISHGT